MGPRQPARLMRTVEPLQNRPRAARRLAPIRHRDRSGDRPTVLREVGLRHPAQGRRGSRHGLRRTRCSSWRHPHSPGDALHPVINEARNSLLWQIRLGNTNPRRAWILSADPNTENLFPHHRLGVLDPGEDERLTRGGTPGWTTNTSGASSETGIEHGRCPQPTRPAPPPRPGPGNAATSQAASTTNRGRGGGRGAPPSGVARPR